MIEQLLRKLPDFKGKHFLANMLFRQKFQASKDLLIDGQFACQYMIPNLTENIGRDIFINGIYEKATIDFLSRIIPPNGYYMDLGANIGAVLIPLCKRRKDITALAVEAAPWIFEYLQKNISLNNIHGVTLLNNALFDQDNVEMNFYSPSTQYGKGSLAPVFSQQGIVVITRRLDSIVNQFAPKKVDAIKIDVEGFEYFVFKGADTLLRANDAPDIVFEFVDWAERQAMDLTPGSAQKLLIEMGYKLFLMEGDKLITLNEPVLSGSYNLFATKKK